MKLLVLPSRGHDVKYIFIPPFSIIPAKYILLLTSMEHYQHRQIRQNALTYARLAFSYGLGAAERGQSSLNPSHRRTSHR